jgi:methylglutaconyl-CoA hydratase
MFAALNTLPIPLIGRIHGAALGGGAGLAAVCDIAIAADDTMFGFTEVKLGILPAVISPYAIAKIGQSAARELFLTGARFSAARAKEIGLIHATGEETELDRIVAKYTHDVLTAGPEAVAAAKRLIADIAHKTPSQAMEQTAEAIARQRVSAEGQEGMRAFLDKRKPAWTDDLG